MTELSPLFSHFPRNSEPSEVSKRGFADMIGLSPARISQLVANGLPVKPNGKIDVVAGRRWYQEHTDPDRRKSQRNGHASAAEELKRIQIDRARLDLERARGTVIDRRAAEEVIFTRARAERDALLAFVARISPSLAQRLGIDPAQLFSELDREIRLHLASVAETPIGDLSDAGDRS